MDKKKIISLRMERQFLTRKANAEEYLKLYRDMQPGQNLYWHGFGQPPVLSFRASFDDIEFNRQRQLKRQLVKGRFSGGNLGWIMTEELELFAALYRKPLLKPTEAQLRILELIEREGPFNIQQLKADTGMLVKQITPILHRLQEAFLIYEDQYDGEWDRGWYKFEEMFPDSDTERYTRQEALKTALKRFSYRNAVFDIQMARSFYKLPEKEIRSAVQALVDEDILAECEQGFILRSDIELLENYRGEPVEGILVMHRNDFTVRSNEHALKEMTASLLGKPEYDHETLQYLLIDGEFHGASVGHFRYGPYDINDIVCDLPDAERRKNEIIDAVTAENPESKPLRFNSREI
ncbi:MAG: hypothetical protein NC394_03585 [Bacteroides sp.]|nr:hypothetical protein [Bacteroides sp.]